MNEKMKGNKVLAEENILKSMIDKRKPIENRRPYTTQSKNGIHLKRKKTLNVKIKDGPMQQVQHLEAGGYVAGWGSDVSSGERPSSSWVWCVLEDRLNWGEVGWAKTL